MLLMTAGPKEAAQGTSAANTVADACTEPEG